MNALVKSESKYSANLTVGQSGANTKQYLTFTLGGEMFSINILCIKEIIWYAN